MLFLKSWLADYIDLANYSDEQLVQLITQKSSEVEEVQTIKDYFEGKVLVGKITNARNHPNADRLKIFDVDLGSKGSVQIVSAAPNVRDGLIVPVAIEGCRLPFLTITSRKMRGEVSEGMCLGQSELMLETEPSDGLWELNKLLENRVEEEFLGKSVCEVLPEFFGPEQVIDIKVLPDKIGTIGSHLGMAIELAVAIGDLSLLTPKARRFIDPQFDFESGLTKFIKTKSDIKIDYQDTTNYSHNFWLFELNLAKTNQYSEYYLPHFFVKRMFLLQKNLVGGLVDLSNYLLLDNGQPTHLFSQAKTILGESSQWKILSLTSPQKWTGLGQLKDTELPVGTVVLADQNQILAVPGISGGESTKTDPHETKVLLEIANFEADEVARNSFLLRYRSDGSKIWAGRVRSGQMLVCLLSLLEVLDSQENVDFQISSVFHWHRQHGNQEFKSAVKTLILENNSRRVVVDLPFIASRLDDQGLQYWQPIIESKLDLLGNFDRQTQILYPRPNYFELNDKYDLLLEISKLIGFENFREHNLITHIQNIRTPAVDAFDKLVDLVATFGFDEVITRPFVSSKQVFDSQKTLKVLKAYRSQENLLRDSLLFSLGNCFLANLNRGEKEPRIFELNKVYQVIDEQLLEKILLAGITSTNDPYLLTSLGLTVLAKTYNDYQILPLDQPLSRVGEGYLYRGQNIDYRLLQLANSFKKELGVPLSKNLWYFEFDLTNWNYKIQTHPNYYDESLYPSIFRSLSLKVPIDFRFDQIEELLAQINNQDFKVFVQPIERLNLTETEDVLNFNLKFVSYTRTLTSDEVNFWQEQFLDSLSKLASIELR